MQIVIELDDIFYEILRIGKRAKTAKLTSDAIDILFKAVINGISLPAEHGRLIDADATCKDIISALGICDENYLLEAEKAVYKRIKNAQTIIEAKDVKE